MEEIIYIFDPEKNKKLIELRSINFEEIITVLDEGKILDILEHPNQIKYPNQKIYVIELNNYAYLVPFLEEGNKIILKTAFPNREATKHYLSERGKA